MHNSQPSIVRIDSEQEEEEILKPEDDSILSHTDIPPSPIDGNATVSS